jgi:hypothetical protein
VVVAAVVTLGGGLVLIPLFGLLGAAVATATGMAIQNLLCVWQVRRVLGFNILAIWPSVSVPSVAQAQALPAQAEVAAPPNPRGKPRLLARPGSTASSRVSNLSIFFILLMWLTLILSLILALSAWPGSAALLARLDLWLYRESILWDLGGVLIAALFAALARIVADLNRLLAAVERGQRGADSDA